MTNAFEKIVHAYFENDSEVETNIQIVKAYHHSIILDLFDTSSHKIFDDVSLEIEKLNLFLKENASTNYDFVYDQVVSVAEILSTKIVSTYLNESGVVNNWFDARNLVKTDAFHRDAKVDWKPKVAQGSTHQAPLHRFLFARWPQLDLAH